MASSKSKGLPIFPYRNPRVQMDLAQPDPDARLILNHETGRYVRLGLREFEWLKSLDGQTPTAGVAALFKQTESFTEEVLQRMAAAKLICFSEEPVKLQSVTESSQSLPARRIEWTRFGQLRIDLGTPTALLRRLSPLTRLLMSWPFVAFNILLAIISLAAIAVQGADFADSVRNFPWRSWEILSLAAMIFGTTIIHELGHALACVRFGAPVRSIGIMFFYLQPAAYADVTDSWQLKNRWHRVAISSAGIYIQALITSLAVFTWTCLRFTGHQDDLVDLAAMFIAINMSMIAFNLIPFVKLDGYWILSNIVGVPNLRDRAVEWCRTVITSGVLQRPVESTRLRYNAVLSMPPLDRSLLACFGLSSMLFGTSMWFLGSSLLFRISSWLGFRGTASFLLVTGLAILIGMAFAFSLWLSRRRNRQSAQISANRSTPATGALVTHAIDPRRPIRLNPHAIIVDSHDETITFAWSTVDSITFNASKEIREIIPRLRKGDIALEQLVHTSAWSKQFEQILQRLWHIKHLRYTSDWDIADENLRYSRQIGWLSMNAEARGKEAAVLSGLGNTSVTILGVGGLGTHLAWNLAACGIGELHLVDGDSIELSNLNRQLFYTPADVGRAKVEVTAEKLKQFRPELRIRTTRKFVHSVQDIKSVIDGSDFVVRSLDTPQEIAQWVNEACIQMNIPHSGAGFLPQGAIVGPTVIPGETACIACDQQSSVPSIDRGIGGTLAPYVVTTAGLLSGEIITYLAKLGIPRTAGRMIIVNAPMITFDVRDYPRNENCPLCGLKKKVA